MTSLLDVEKRCRAPLATVENLDRAALLDDVQAAAFSPFAAVTKIGCVEAARDRTRLELRPLDLLRSGAGARRRWRARRRRRMRQATSPRATIAKGFGNGRSNLPHVKIFVIGAGQVGTTIVQALHDEHELTVFDLDEERLAAISQRYDVAHGRGERRQPARALGGRASRRPTS